MLEKTLNITFERNYQYEKIQQISQQTHAIFHDGNIDFCLRSKSHRAPF